MLTIEKLNQFGANTQEGLTRCFGNEGLYLRLTNTIPGEASFDKLEKAIGDNNLDAAFEAAHALKGVLGNLSLDPLCKPANEMTELLRSRTETDYSALLKDLLDKRDELKALCESD